MTEDSTGRQKRKSDLDILAEYEELLEDYNLILEISGQVLEEIKKGFDENVLLPLLERKLLVADRISLASKRMSQVELTGRNSVQLEIVKQAKSIIAQIKNRAEVLHKCENRIEEVLKEKGLKIR